MPVWQSLLFNHIIPSIFNAAVMLLLVLVIFKVFRIKNPATRFFFLFLPMVKAFVVLLDNPLETQILQTNKTFQIGARMPDPLNLITSPVMDVGELIYDGSALLMIFLLAAAVIFSIIAARWLQLFRFRNRFKYEETLSRDEYPEVYKILDTLVPKLKVAYPRVVVSNIYQYVPFSVGYRLPIMVVSRELLAEFPREQLEIMLAHELAHMLRKDNLTGWLALILRDIMFFNPIVRLVYSMIEAEKEKTCDRIALDITNAVPHTAANILVDVALFYKQISPTQQQAYPVLAKALLKRQSRVEHRIASMAQTIRKRKPSFLRTSLKTILFAILVYLQITLTLNINGTHIFMR